MTQTIQATDAAITSTHDWLKTVIDRVSQHEGRYDSLNRNIDGQGLSFGFLQWSQSTGSLGILLTEMRKQDEAKFDAIFEEASGELIRVTTAASLAPVQGAVLWKEPWVARFQKAGREPVFQEVQRRLAAKGEHMKGALDAAKLLNLYSERSLALFFDTAVQQGPGHARNTARQIRQELEGKTLTVSALLTRYAQLCAAPFRRLTQPASEWYNQRRNLRWKQVGSEWHVFAGKVDLFADITRRRMGIVKDVALSDQPIPSEKLV